MKKKLYAAAYNQTNTTVYVGWQCLVFCGIENLSRKRV